MNCASMTFNEAVNPAAVRDERNELRAKEIESGAEREKNMKNLLTRIGLMEMIAQLDQ